MKNVVIIGAGPAGVMAAIAASEKNNVVLLDGNEKIGKKLFITGKGRCNVTNSKDISDFFDYIYGNSNFLYSALYSFTNEDTMEFFENKGVKLKSERGGRVFPESDKSSDIIKGLKEGLNKSNIKVKLSSKVTNIFFENKKIFAVEINGKERIKGDHFILATGGASYPLTGSTGDGFKFSKVLGHSVTALKPSLVPMEFEDMSCGELNGLNLRNIQLSLVKSGYSKALYKEQGEILFTNYGARGPLILKASRFVRDNEKYKIILDLKPALTQEELDKRIQKDFKKYSNLEFKESLKDLLPSKIIPVIVKESGICENKKVNEVRKEERKNLVKVLKELTIDIKKLRPIEEAIVTSGGISVKEIDSSTMKSKIIENLSFAGEIIDVDAFTGGYNVQIAISTGYLAGKTI